VAVETKRDVYFRELGERAIRDAGITEPPVAPLQIARHLGVPIISAVLPSWSGGALVAEDGMPAILINAGAEAFAQRATIAHFLGHLIVLIDDPGATYPRDREVVHESANAVADELELPGFMVRDQALKWFNDHRYLAGLFGVTEKRMVARMQALGLMQKRGVVWDY
jgi:Zn-dependent peptidase ImmA (M78 family)